jgi:hypothetical protein
MIPVLYQNKMVQTKIFFLLVKDELQALSNYIVYAQFTKTRVFL